MAVSIHLKIGAISTASAEGIMTTQNIKNTTTRKRLEFKTEAVDFGKSLMRVAIQSSLHR